MPQAMATGVLQDPYSRSTVAAWVQGYVSNRVRKELEGRNQDIAGDLYVYLAEL